MDAALDKADNVALITSLYGAMVKMGPLLGMKETPKPDALVKVGTVTGYKINGDKATAQNGAETMDFVRIDGRWYIEPPASKGIGRVRSRRRRQVRRGRPAAAPRRHRDGQRTRDRGRRCPDCEGRRAGQRLLGQAVSTRTTAPRSCCG